MTRKEWEGAEWAEMVANQLKNPTMDKKLCITVCPVGALFSRMQNPNLPRSPQEIAKETIESYNEGACMAHLHNRDEYGKPVTTTELLKETVDVILDKCPDMIIQPSSCEGYIPGSTQYSYETVKPMVDALHGINRKYMESTIFTPVSYAARDVDGSLDYTLATEENMVKTITYLNDHHIKPEFMAHNWEGILNVKEWLIKPGILQKPYFISMGPGMHNAAETYPDPWGLIYLLGMVKMMPGNSVVGISAGGRNWLALSTFAILLGVDFVRVGMEDHLWMYPHKDEKIKRCADATKKIATIAKELGRDIATPEEARKILGIL
jgi:3-keto-5-aminohexanoate cleavage enzyme